MNRHLALLPKTLLQRRPQIPAGACVLAALRCSRTSCTLRSGARRKLRPRPGFAGGRLKSSVASAIVAALWAAACTCNKSEQAVASAEAPKGAAPTQTGAAISSAPPVEVQPSSWPIPSGLRLSILAGKGVGPIRFGATVQTIERLMDLPCEIRTEDSCRYIARAIDFKLKDGVAVEMHLHRVDRAATPDGRTYGVFNGRTPEGVAFMMLPTGVDELLGKPTKAEPAQDPGPWGMVEIREYPGIRLEFDRLPTGKVILGGIVLTKADVPDKPQRP